MRAERAERVTFARGVWGLNGDANAEGLNGEKVGLFRLPCRGKFWRYVFGCGAAVAGPVKKKKREQISKFWD